MTMTEQARYEAADYLHCAGDWLLDEDYDLARGYLQDAAMMMGFDLVPLAPKEGETK